MHLFAATPAKLDYSPTAHAHRRAAEVPNAASAVLNLQRAYGNQFVRGMIQRACACQHRPARDATEEELQTKLDIPVNRPGDHFEREADLVAERVVRDWGRSDARAASTSPPVAAFSRSEPTRGMRKEEDGDTEFDVADAEVEQSEADDIETEDDVDGELAAAGSGLAVMSKTEAGATPARPSWKANLLTENATGGQPLPRRVSDQMEASFGRDFGRVRIHADATAAQMARSLRAQAFTYGRDIYFGTGRYNPGSVSGRRLLAHELTHVVQQGAAERLGGSTHRASGSARRLTGAGTRRIQRKTLVEEAGAGCGVCYGSARLAGTAAHRVVAELWESVNRHPELPVNCQSLGRSRRPDLVQVVGNTWYIGSLKPARAVYYQRGRDDFLSCQRCIRAAYPQARVQPLRVPAPSGLTLPHAYAPGGTMGNCPRQKLYVNRPDANGVYGYYCRPPRSQLRGLPGCRCRPVRRRKPKNRRRNPRPGTSTRAPSRAPSRAPNRAPTRSRTPTRSTNRAPSRSPSRTVNRPSSRAPSRAPHDVRPRGGVPASRAGRTVERAAMRTRNTSSARRAAQAVGEAAQTLERRLALVASQELVQRRVRSFLQRRLPRVLAARITRIAASKAAQRAAALIPVLGWGVAGVDAYHGLRDIFQGHVARGLAGVGCAAGDVAADVLHLGDAVSGVGGTALSLAAQAGTTACQVAIEMSRYRERMEELEREIGANHALPSDSRLSEYYDLDDEAIRELKAGFTEETTAVPGPTVDSPAPAAPPP